MLPLWSGTRIENESVLMVSTGAAAPVGQLLYTPASIVSVCDSSLGMVYQQGTDWTLSGRTLTAPPGSRIPSTVSTTLSPYLLDESHGWHQRQISVTYNHAGTWTGPTATTSTKLTTTLGKLNSGANVKIAFFGDSITVGASVSGYGGYALPLVSHVPPFQPIWPLVVLDMLRRKYPTAAISWINKALGGETSAGGLARVGTDVTPFAADLDIVAYGMNDKTGGVTAATYGSNVAGIISNIRGGNASAEIIVVNSMRANPGYSAGAAALEAGYLSQLTTIAGGSGIELVDMSTWHQTLVAAKKYEDMTGNGVNHPNDFLARGYAQLVCGLLGCLP